MRAAVVVVSICSLFLFTDWSNISSATFPWDENTPLSEVMIALGEPRPHHYRNITDETVIRRGYEIVTKGKTIGPDGKMSSRISRHFQCTDCHNIQREDPDLTVSDPETRLQYVADRNIPFLQGTTLWGIVNRRSWYNDDYIKKYGDLVLPTNDTLINAIQLCCSVCSQGRYAEDWEVEAMLAYFYSIQLKLGDLNMSKGDYATLAQDRLTDQEKINMLREKYLTKSPATFLEPQYGNDRKYGENGRPQMGKMIYEQSCMHCHDGDGVTEMTLVKDVLDFRFLNKHLSGNDEKSIYVITRRGTYPHLWYKPYMPLYTKERMSEQQVEDLVAFIKSKS